MIPKRLSFLFLLLLNSWLVACTNSTNTEPTLILPTPITNNEENTAVIPTAIIPTEIPEETAVEPTPTLVPTATPTAEPVPAAETDPSVQSISSPPLPAANRDLLFLADGAFKMWNHTSGQIETIVAGADSANRTIDPLAPAESFVGDITSFAMSADGKRAVVARLLAEETVTRSSGPNSNSYEDVRLFRKT